MRTNRTNRTFRSFYDHQLQSSLTTKRNISEVEGILTQYQKNNKSLISQVQDLIRENQMLKKTHISDMYSPCKKQVHFTNKNLTSSFKQNKSALTEANQYLGQMSPLSKVTSHPRNIYLDHSSLKKQNMSTYVKVKQMQKKYQNQKGYTKYKQAKTKKQQMQNLQISRKAYLEQGSLQFKNGQQFQQDAPIKNQKQNCIKIVDQYEYTNTGQFSPCNMLKTDNSHSRNKMKYEREIYQNSNIKLIQPSTKWKDIADGVLSNQKSKHNAPLQRFTDNSQRKSLKTNWQSKQFSTTNRYNLDKQGKKKRKQFLSLVSSIHQ